MKMLKNNMGITLIALVITIIVLIILAGVSIALLTGENGILTKATTASEETKKQGALEKVKIAVAGSIDNNGKYNVDLAKTNIEKEVEGSIVTKNADNSLTVKVDGYTIEVSINGKVLDPQKEGELESLPSTDTTKPYLPSNDFEKENETDLNNGLVIKDGEGNSYVWVEVPKTIFNTATSSIDYENIEIDMQTYASDYRKNGWEDIWYDGCGLTEIEYNNLKNKMLTSVYDNGGFWISQYEIGIENSFRSYGSEYFIEHPTMEKPISKEGMYVYNWVRITQAQSLANQINSGNCTSSLLFGVQWDLTLKFIEEKGKIIQEQIKTDSTNWGNYSNSTFVITNGKYSTDYGISYLDVKGTYTNPSTISILLSTGATNRNSSMNIYDLAGNVGEWTLEKGEDSSKPTTGRGGSSYTEGSYSPSNFRYNSEVNYCDTHNGIRVALY